MKRVVVGRNQKKQIIIDAPGEYLIELLAPQAEAEVLGVLEAAGSDRLEANVVTHHKAKNTSSEIFIRAVVRDQAKVILNGMIKVDRGAGKTNAFLTENVLLLSEEASADAVPNLEIKTDDVKASHAATIGKINPEQLFYLMSRGVSRKEAERIIVEGFLSIVRKRIK